MKKILLLGAGRSSSHLIDYLLKSAGVEGWRIRIGDLDLATAQAKAADSVHAEAFQLNADRPDQRREEIAGADLVISMLPAFMHPDVAKDCIAAKKHLITPSYISDEMKALDSAAKSAGILLLNEMGVDPGIDHMSAMQIIDHLRNEGVELTGFESFTGGLIAPESDNNPWHYKITWNPRNVVLAGYGGTARFQQNGALRFVPYHRLFTEITTVEVDGHGKFEGYANRDSVKYKAVYGLERIPTLIRGTLRKDGFSAAWNALIQLGLTDDSFELENGEDLTWRQLTYGFSNASSMENLETSVQKLLNADAHTMHLLTWLGIFEYRPVGLVKGSPAAMLQRLIEEKWKLEENDKDMIVMWHRFHFTSPKGKECIESSLVVEGDDPIFTAMSKTVGLPIAMAAKRILDGTFNQVGVHLPITPDFYLPILAELEEYGVVFREKRYSIQ